MLKPAELETKVRRMKKVRTKPFRVSEDLRGALRRLSILAGSDPGLADLVRDGVRAAIRDHIAQLAHEVAVAEIAAGGKYCDEALELLAGTVDALPRMLVGVQRDLERELLRRTGH